MCLLQAEINCVSDDMRRIVTDAGAKVVSSVIAAPPINEGEFMVFMVRIR